MEYGERVTRAQLGAEIDKASKDFERHGRVDIVRMQTCDRGRFNWYMDLRGALLSLSTGFETTVILTHRRVN
jgi:hypothetical protein